MIDLHCHILPGIDDGPHDLQETLEMCRLSVAEGMTAIVATPHLYHSMFATTREQILETHAAVREALASEGIPLELFLGADMHLHPDLAGNLVRGEALTLDGGRYFLLELPSRLLPPNLEEIVDGLMDTGYTPILTHPERNEVIVRHEKILLDLLAQGCLCQVTAMSVTGDFGKRCEGFTRSLLEAGAVHFIASDAHSTGWRHPGVREALRVAENLIGSAPAGRLVLENPQAVLSGNPVARREVKALPKNRRFWRF